MDLLSPTANTSLNTYRMFMLSHSKTEFLLKVKYTKRDNAFYCAVLNIKRFDIALIHLHYKIRKNGDSVSLIVVIA